MLRCLHGTVTPGGCARELQRGDDLPVRSGGTRAIRGPDGSGESTLAYSIAGHPKYTVTGGTVTLDGEDVLAMSVDERARAGLFLAMQYPVEIPGVTVTKYLRMVMNAHREARGEKEISLKEFRRTVEEAMELTRVKREFSQRYLNDGFSGGEKKRLEILQLALQEPKVAILDETDSGLDIDALRIVAKGIREIRADRPKMGVVLITHYQRLLDEVAPDHVHIMVEGRIVASGGMELAAQLESDGYEAFR